MYFNQRRNEKESRCSPTEVVSDLQPETASAKISVNDQNLFIIIGSLTVVMEGCGIAE